MTHRATFRARSASDRTDDWPYWYVTDDNPHDSNKTADCFEALTGRRQVCLPFLSRLAAEKLATLMNERQDQASTGKDWSKDQ